MKGFNKIGVMICFFALSLLFLASESQCQYGFPHNYGSYWQTLYNQPYQNHPNWNRSNPFTSYNPYQNQMAFVNPSSGRQAPYFRQNNQYQINSYGSFNSNYGYPGPYNNEYNLFNSHYYGNNYVGNDGYSLSGDSYDGPSTYFHLLPSDYILRNDPYTLAQQAKRDLQED